MSNNDDSDVYLKCCLNKWVLRLVLKVWSVEQWWRWGGSTFQRAGANTEKQWSAQARRVRGTVRRIVALAERSALLAYTGWPHSSCRLVRHRCTGSCEGGTSVCSRLAGESTASAVPAMLKWHGHIGADPSPGRQRSSGLAAVPGVQWQTGLPTKSYSSQPWTSPRTARPWHRYPCPESVWCCWWCAGDGTWRTWRSGSGHACSWWSPWWCRGCGGGHCMHSDATNAHSRLQHSVGGLVLWSCDDHELHLIAVDLKLVGEQPDPGLLHTHLQPLQRMPVAVQVP